MVYCFRTEKPLLVPLYCVSPAWLRLMMPEPLSRAISCGVTSCMGILVGRLLNPIFSIMSRTCCSTHCMCCVVCTMPGWQCGQMCRPSVRCISDGLANRPQDAQYCTLCVGQIFCPHRSIIKGPTNILSHIAHLMVHLCFSIFAAKVQKKKHIRK